MNALIQKLRKICGRDLKGLKGELLYVTCYESGGGDQAVWGILEVEGKIKVSCIVTSTWGQDFYQEVMDIQEEIDKSLTERERKLFNLLIQIKSDLEFQKMLYDNISVRQVRMRRGR